ncbi:MAG TPA: hypothetical protein PLH94_04590 [Fimbriimonadaceae bacterium]|nr:hypothetical protein [Fimbriimonadaceae bacterium]
MSRIAAWLARRLWFAMLWLMRRPWMRRLQRWTISRVPPERRDAARRSMYRQDRFARRHGLRVLTFAITLLLGSLLLTLFWFLGLALYEAGALTPPER